MKTMNKKVEIEIDSSEMDKSQERLIRQINSVLAYMMVTDEETEYFNYSRELLRLVGHAVKDANFSKYWKENAQIAYSEQALEFGVDALSEEIHSLTLPQDN